MKVMIFDVPAERGGALSVLNDFYNEVLKYNQTNSDIEWLFVVSTPFLEEKKNIKVLSFPWIKKSWFHRLFFDYLVAPKLLKNHGVDKVFSLQNLVIRTKLKIPQVLYIHQTLPFINYSFKFFNQPKLWIYQNILGKSILDSVAKSSTVIVQTEWLKSLIKDKKDENKIKVIPPYINTDGVREFEYNKATAKKFFFPAGALPYKNHQLIIDACKKLKYEEYSNYEIIFTLKGDENDYAKNLYKQVKENELPVKFIGNISRDEALNKYSKTVLLFPSYVESYGLPLLEARLSKSIILSADTPFSREILNGYREVRYFEAFDYTKLAAGIRYIAEGNYTTSNKEEQVKIHRKNNNIIDTIINDN